MNNYEQQLKTVFDSITVEVPENEVLKFTTYENFKNGAQKLINLVYLEGVRDGLKEAESILTSTV